MGIIGRFEKGLDRAVNGVFAKAFRSEVQPVEIASALRRECDDKAQILGRDRTITPNTFVVELGTADHERLGEWEQALSNELGVAVHDHARQQHYAFVGGVAVTFERAEDLDTGVFRVRSSITPDEGAPPGPQGAVAAPPYGAGQGLSPAPSGAPCLEVNGRIQRLAASVTVIGRGADADVVVDDAGVSRRHAEVHLIDGRARVIDLGSTNGTFVDGERVHAGNLTEGSTITVGRTRIVFHGGQW